MDDITSLILENEDLIYSVANKFNKYKSIDDLYQVGCIGMIEAYKNFDASRNTKFTTYAYPYIFGAMSNFVREDNTVKISRDLSRLKSKIDKARVILTQKLMKAPTNYELSEYLNIPLQDLESVINYNSQCYSMDEMLYDDAYSMHEIIGGKDIDYDTLIALKTELSLLGEPERTIMINRYFEDMTQTEIANNLGLSQVDVSRREKKVLVKLRKTLN